MEGKREDDRPSRRFANQKAAGVGLTGFSSSLSRLRRFFDRRGRPEPHRAIEAAACHEGAILREGDPFDYAHMPLQSQGHLVRGHVPKFQSTAFTRGGQSGAVRAERDRRHSPGMGLKRRWDHFHRPAVVEHDVSDPITDRQQWLGRRERQAQHRFSKRTGELMEKPASLSVPQADGSVLVTRRQQSSTGRQRHLYNV